MRYVYRGPQHITLRNQKLNAEVFAHCQHRSLGVMSCSLSSEELLPLIRDSASALGINMLKPEQEKAILQFLLGRDVFVALPTGYRKSLCYFVLPLVFDSQGCEQSIDSIVVSPRHFTGQPTDPRLLDFFAGE